MKKKNQILLFFLAVIFCVHSAAAVGIVSAAPAKKSGLVKEKGKYYYYEKGVKQLNTWKTIKVGTKKYKYYFDKSGAAYAGKKKDGVVVPAVKKIGKYTYAFDQMGRMLTGVRVIGEKFYVFSGKGQLNAKKTSKLWKAAKYKKALAPLKKLLSQYGAKCKKTEYYGSSCFGDGEDGMLHYNNFTIAVFKPTKGKPVVYGIYPAKG